MESEVSRTSELNGEVHNSSQADTVTAVNHSGDGPMLNGYSNGIEEKVKSKDHSDEREHKDKHKEKHRDKDRDREKDKHRDKDREKDKHRDREKDKHREKDRSDRDKDRSDRDKDHKSSSSSHKSKDKDRDKEREKDKDRHREKDRDKERDRDREKDKEKHKSSSSSSHKDKDRDKERSKDSKHSSSSRDKDKSKSSSSKDKERSDRDKERSDKERSEKKEKSDKDKDRSEKDKERERDKEKSKDRHDKEKSDRHKDRDKSKSDRDKDKHKEHRDKEKEKHREEKEPSSVSTSKEKEKKKEHKESVEGSQKPKLSIPDAVKDVKRKILSDSEDDDDDGNRLQIVEEPEIKQEPMDQDEEENSLAPMDVTEDSNAGGMSGGDTTWDESRVKTEPEEEDSEEDIPLSARAIKSEPMSEDEDDEPLSNRKTVKKEKKRKKDLDYEEEEEEEEDYRPKKKKIKKEPKATKKIKSEVKTETSSPTKKKKAAEEEQDVWKWWEEDKKPDGVKWTFLEHKGPVFAPPYEPLPQHVKFFYEGKEMKLSMDTEEVATFYARMLEHDYVTKEAFNKNFFKDWRKVMTSKEKETITDLSKCNFKAMHAYFVQKSEERKAMTKEEKKVIKEKNEELVEEYGFCIIDGHKEKIGNFKLEPPGLFRGRGEHPKMGMLKKRLNAEDIIINCSKDAKVPEPPEGHKWKEVKHDNTVTWLASWTENVQGQVKYIMLNPSSKLKGEKDWQKYETARKLAKSIDKIRNEYQKDWKSKEMRIRQRAVALYFIDKLALRAGNEKDEDQADTVGCCSLRVEHIELHPEKDGKEFVVVFDFLGKDSIRYYNEVPVEKRVFKNLQLFMENKKPGDDLFDRLNTQILNKHLNELMEGLTAKVFRTYNASWTLQQQLKELTNPEYSIPEMILAYNRANRAVAILCNHQRSIPKSHQKSMENIKGKINAKKEAIDEAERQYKSAKKEAKHGSAKEQINADKAKKKLERLKEQLRKLEVTETDKEENKTIALGTSKLNYLDPRISVAWCKKYNIPIEKIYNKTQRMKFRWAIDMATPEYVF